MLMLVEIDLPANRLDVGLLGAAAVLPHPQNLDDAVVEAGRSFVEEQA
jgi:hypothetical protein